MGMRAADTAVPGLRSTAGSLALHLRPLLFLGCLAKSIKRALATEIKA